MLRKLSRRLSYANVMSTVGVFIALGGTAYAVNTVGSTDIIDGEVKSVDIGNNEIGSSDVKDNSLNTFDVHSFLGVDVVDETLTGADLKNGSLDGRDLGREFAFSGNIGNVGAQSCVDREVTGTGLFLDHVVLTPEISTSEPFFTYTALMGGIGGAQLFIRACNHSPVAVNDGSTYFYLLEIEAVAR